jgi:CubicO group peptidase (beta-lactamase class C family)
MGETYALLLVHRGAIVAERYAEDHGEEERLPSWSMAKSITHALVGMALRQGLVDPHAPAPIAAWQEADDPRRAITLEHLLRMCDGLEFVEDYVDRGVSHVIEMLFGAGRDDVAAFAAARPLAHPPGTFWSYSSGSSNLVARVLGDAVGGGRAGMESFMHRELFAPLGMTSADPRFDAAGTFIGSSFVFATARDFARFGLLYLRGGRWEGARLLPEGWDDHARTPTRASGGEYGAHWWLALDGSGRFSANGYRGQYLVVDPRRDLVLVPLGGSTPKQRAFVLRLLADLVHAFPSPASP